MCSKVHPESPLDLVVADGVSSSVGPVGPLAAGRGPSRSGARPSLVQTAALNHIAASYQEVPAMPPEVGSSRDELSSLPGWSAVEP